MLSQNRSVSKQRQHNRVLLSPIKKSKKRKVLESRQKNFVLDCTNGIKSKVEQYNYIKDKYLNYFVVKVPKRKRNLFSSGSKSCEGKQNLFVKDHANFKNFLESKREQIIAQANLTKGFKFKQPIAQKQKQKNEKDDSDEKVQLSKIQLSKVQNNQISQQQMV